jgi:hypothetical protein
MSSPAGLSSATFPLSLYFATIVLYSILIVPTFYIWRCHGRPGFLAYNFIYAFCAIRIAGGALSIAAVHNADLETSATVVNSLAISPLILAGLGFLHEARIARIASLRSRREWVLVGIYHSIVTTAIVLVVIGIVNVMKGLSTTQGSGLIKAGLAVLIVSYVVLLAWTTVSLRAPDKPKTDTFIDGTVVSLCISLICDSKNNDSSSYYILLLPLCLSLVCDLSMESHRSYWLILLLRVRWQQRSF